MQADDPPYLSVGTAVSAKYKGAFCEAKVSKVVRIVKCKVTYKMGLGTATVSDEQIKGTLRVGQLVQAKHPEKKEFVDATITKIQDCSQYTVVFDDGDITTLRRTALCLKSGRHFNESETLDQLPLTHPEHFGNPVVGGRRGRRNRQMKEDSSEEEVEEENEPDLEGYSVDIGRVVSIEATDKKRTKDNWFPGLVVIPSAQPTVRINVKDEYLVRSFKDGRYYTVPKKEVTQFTREMGDKVESPVLAEAVHKALKFLDSDELPVHWERTSLFNLQSLDSDSEENYSDSSDDGPSEEKDLFVAQLYKFMEDSRTPLNSSPTISKRDVDLHRLFRVVEKFGGYNRVTNQNKWRIVTLRLKFPNTQNIFNQVKQLYKTCLLSYESFYRTLGVTMHVNTRSTKKNRGRSLIRDKDRNTPVNITRIEKEEEIEKREEKEEKPIIIIEDTPKRKIEPKKELPEKKKKDLIEISDNNSSDATDQSEPPIVLVADSGRPKRNENKIVKDKKLKVVKGEKVKLIIEQFEEQAKKEEDKTQVTRSKSLCPKIQIKEIPKESIKETVKEVPTPEKKKEPKSPIPEVVKPTTSTKIVKKIIEEEKKRGRKRLNADDKASTSDSSTTDLNSFSNAVNKGDKLKVYYGPTHESKVTYEAKVIEIDGDSAEPMFLVHYTGWNTRYDEWISQIRIAENLSTTKAKRLKQNSALQNSKNVSGTPSLRVAAKRGRGMSITGRSTIPDPPRSTTPSSVTSSSSRTKSPATPVTRLTGRASTRKDSNKRSRRTSLQTDISVHSESELEVSECEIEITRTRSVSKNEQDLTKTKTIIKKMTEKQETEKEGDGDRPKRARKMRKFIVDIKNKSEDDDTEKEEEERERPKRIRKIKKFHDDEYDTDKDEEIEKRKKTTRKSKKSEEEEDTEKEEEPEKIKRFLRKLKKSEDEDTEKDDEVERILPKRLRKTKKSEAEYDTDLEEDSEVVKRPLRKTKKSEDDDTEKEEECEQRPKRKRKPRKFDDDSPIKEDQDTAKIKKGKKIEKLAITDSDEENTNPPKGRDFDLNQIRSELKGLKVPSIDPPDLELGISDEGTEPSNTAPDDEEEQTQEIKRETPSIEKSPSSEDIYEFKEPEPFEFETRKLIDEKNNKKRLPRIFDDVEKSPKKNKIKVEKAEDKESCDVDKKWFNKTPVKKQQSDLERDEDDIKEEEDAFDKLVESPSYNIIKTVSIQQQQRVKKFFEEPLSLLSELSETVEDYSTDRLELSDSESQGQPIFTRGDELFSDSFSKSPSATNLELDFNKPEEPKTKDSDEEDLLRESIKRIAEATCTDEDSNDTLRITPPTTNYSIKKKEPELIVTAKPLETCLSTILGLSKEPEVSEPPPLIIDNKNKVEIPITEASPIKQISPALQESDSSILESIVSTKPILLNLSLDDAPTELNVSKDLNLKTGTKIADTILQKINSVKNNKMEIKSPVQDTEYEKVHIQMEDEEEEKFEIETEELKIKPTAKLLNPKLPVIELKLKPTTEPQVELKCKKPSSPVKFEHIPEIKKRRKVVSRPYIEESDSDSSDSEQLIIARSDEESQTNSMENKPDIKGSDSDNISVTQDITDDSQSQEEPRNFKFSDIKKDESPALEVVKDDVLPPNKTSKTDEEEPDSQLHNLLICDETIPRSPGPSNECSSSTVENKNKSKSILEMPFASAPSSSNTKSILLVGDKPVNKPQTPPLLPLGNRSNRDVSTVLDNTPPMTPESTISLSPRGENEGLSPNAADNESCKSNEAEPDFSRKLNPSNKVSPYSEEDTQTGDSHSTKKLRDDVIPASCKKRRRSTRTEDSVPAKRGRKPLNRSRHNSDSDDTSEHSISGSTTCITTTFDRTSRSPRPSKYNFFVEFDPSLDSGQRIAVLTQKLAELRKTYADVKAELATVERRRKKLRRREREALKTAKQELTCA